MKRRWYVVLAMVMFAASLSACAGGPSMTITAEFEDTAGLFVGNDVGVLGVRVGEVTELEPTGQVVKVTMEIDEGVQIPATAGAVIVSRSVATDRYVELTPVYDSGPTLTDGAMIEAKRTRVPVEFDELLASLTSLTDAIAGPDQSANALSDVLDVGAKVLDGNGEVIAQTVADLADALAAVNGGSGDFEGIVENLDILTQALATNDATVREFGTSVAQVTTMLDQQHVAIERTFDALSVMLEEVAAFARDHHAEIGDQLVDIASLSQTLVDHQNQLAETLEVFPLMMQNVSRAVDSDGRLNMRLRPGDLIPGRIALEAVCGELPVDLCELLKPEQLTIFDLLDQVAGVSK